MKHDDNPFDEGRGSLFAPPPTFVSIKLSYNPPSTQSHDAIVARLRKLIDEVIALGCVCTITTVDVDGIERKLDI